MVPQGELALTQAATTVNEITATAADTVAMDTVEAAPQYAILLTPEKVPEAAPRRSDDSTGVSFILCGLFLLGLVIALRFRNNIKYAVTMFRNLVETRTRHNIFDDTVRETSLIVLLNILWCGCAGIVAYCAFESYGEVSVPWTARAAGMAWGMVIAVAYEIFMWFTYYCVGWVFSDRTHADLWVKGFSASQALMTPALFVTALVAICRPEAVAGAAGVSVAVFIMAKLMFIWKGYRIFFNQISSWVLFLCYLCSLEIVPLILCYRSAVLLGEVLG